jgi:hypothetical protein
MAMEQTIEHTDEIHASTSFDRAHQPLELWKLVRKLRWIGMEEEARRLQLRMRRMSPEHDRALRDIQHRLAD